ncbi:8731_t:CDS:2, partial [Dentiscutata erythropus]
MIVLGDMPDNSTMDMEAGIQVNEKRLEKLKRHVEAQAKLRAKKQKQLEDEKFRSAHTKRQKTVIKVCTIKHLCKALEEKYNLYLSCYCLSTYLKPRHKYIFAARHHYYLAKVSLASVAKTDIRQHIDEHYCLASVKAARVFAEVFANDIIIISQDNKAKIGLDISA